MEETPPQPPTPDTQTPIICSQDSLTRQDVTALLEAHFAAMHADGLANNQPIHALDLSALNSPSITIFTARSALTDELMGCAALRELAPGHGEIKSMRTVTGYLRKGVAAALVQHLMEVARARGWRRVSLETGVRGEFAPARRLYEKFGFVECERYGEYENPTSVYMTFYFD